MSDAAAEARRDAQELRILLKCRALRAMAESSEFPAEAEAFTAKARQMAQKHDIEADLLDFPTETLRVAVVMAELRRLKAILVQYHEDDRIWETKTAEWSDYLDEYDAALEVAADILNIAVPRLPYGSRRHFRPGERAMIEEFIFRRVSYAPVDLAVLHHESTNGESAVG